MEALLHVFRCVFRLEKDMTRVEHVPLLLKHFDDMESVRCLDDLGYITFLESHGRIRELWPEDRLRSHSELTALSRAARVLRIDTRKSRELLTVDDTLADRQKALLHSKLRSLPVRIYADLAELVHDRNYRKILRISSINILLYIVRSQFRNISHDLALHLLCKSLIFK